MDRTLKAVDKGVKSSRVDHSLGEVWRVLSNRSEHVGSSFLVESLKNKKFKKNVQNSNCLAVTKNGQTFKK
jgi:hypothetical protein